MDRPEHAFAVQHRLSKPAWHEAAPLRRRLPLLPALRSAWPGCRDAPTPRFRPRDKGLIQLGAGGERPAHDRLPPRRASPRPLTERGYRRSMDLSVVFLGTGGSVPTARRATACLLARVGGERLLFDCGEGSQRQMHRSIGLVQVDEIYVTHYHADHYLGLPGLLKTYDLQARERPLRIVGPPGLDVPVPGARPDLRPALLRGRAGGARRGRGDPPRRLRGPLLSRSSIGSAPTATRWSRTSARGASTRELAASLGVEPGPDFGRLQARRARAGERRPGSPRAGDGRAAPRPQGRGHRGHRAV